VSGLDDHALAGARTADPYPPGLLACRPEVADVVPVALRARTGEI
jgi:hypothetical protein